MSAAIQLRRSFAQERLQAAGARFEDLGQSAVAVSFRNATDELVTAKRMGLADLSPLPRFGFKGPGTCKWVKTRGVSIPEAPNLAAVQDDGGLALRLAQEELFLLGSLQAGAEDPAELEVAWQASHAKQKGFPLPRQETHAWFMITGSNADAMLAKLCGVDLRPAKFANMAIAQTSMARMSAVICRHDLNGTLAYHLVFDSASACYLWDCLIDAMAEFQGGPFGLTALRNLLGA